MICYLRALGSATGDRFLTKLTGATLKSQAKVYILWVKTEVSHLSGRSHFNFTEIFNYHWFGWNMTWKDLTAKRQDSFAPNSTRKHSRRRRMGVGNRV